MSSLPEVEYEVLRESIISACDAAQKNGWSPFSEPFEVGPGDFIPPARALRNNMRTLDTVEAFALVYTNKQATSALIELGYALKRGIPIAVFAKEGVTLPYHLREADQVPEVQVTLLSFKELSELPVLFSQQYPPRT